MDVLGRETLRGSISRALSPATLDNSLGIGSNRSCREVISCCDAWPATTERSRYQGSMVFVLIPAVERTAHSLRAPPDLAPPLGESGDRPKSIAGIVGLLSALPTPIA
jgi:hypothetical protein